MSLNLFDSWNKEKQKINSIVLDTVFVNSREVWYAKLGQNIGSIAKGEFIVIKKLRALLL